MRERDLFPPLKRHFESLGYATYGEVPAPHGGYVDLLAIRDDISVAVELKSSFSLEAVRQAARNRRYVWESFVAVPEHARIPARRRSTLLRHGAGLVSVDAGGAVKLCAAARREAPPCTVHQAFGRHLRAALAGVYAAADGGVPTVERVSAPRVLLEKLRECLAARGGIANTDDLLEATLPWNYCSNRAGGLRWMLRRNFRALAPDLWAGDAPRRPEEFALAKHALVRTHLPRTFVCLPAPDFLPRPGDLLLLAARRARVISASRHEIIQTPQREWRAGTAIFFPWRCATPPVAGAPALVVTLA